MTVDRSNVLSQISLGDIVTWSSNRTPDKTAIIFPELDKEVTFSEFNERVNQAAHAFLDSGLRRGDRVGFVTDNSERLLVAQYGGLKAGLVTSLNNTQQDVDTITYQLSDAEVDAVVVDDEYYQKVKPFLEENSIKTLTTIDWDGKDTPGETLESFISGKPTSEPDVEVDRADPALMMYTSGTTARPKGVVHTHESYIFNVINVMLKLDIGIDDVVGQVLPLFHISESQQRGALAASATSVIFRGFDPDQFLSNIERQNMTLFALVSSMYRRLFTEGQIFDRDYSSVRRCIYGMPMEMSMRKQVIDTFDAELQLFMGQTESGVLMYLDHEWQLEKEGNYIGKSAPFGNVAVMSEDGELLPAGEEGEIVFRGPSIMDRYLNREEKTREVSRHGWHHTEDIGMFDEDGLLLFIDRKKDIIKTGGENVSSTKVQNVISDHPAVNECVAVGLPHDRWGEAVTMFVVLDTDADVTAEEIRSYARERLAGFETPKAIEFVDEIPQNATGKLLKKDLAEEYSEYYQ